MGRYIPDVVSKAQSAYRSDMAVLIESTDHKPLYGHEEFEQRETLKVDVLWLWGVDRDEFNAGNARELLDPVRRAFLSRHSG